MVQPFKMGNVSYGNWRDVTVCEKGFYTPVGSETGALYKNQREAARSQQWFLADNPQGNRGLRPAA